MKFIVLALFGLAAVAETKILQDLGQKLLNQAGNAVGQAIIPGVNI